MGITSLLGDDRVCEAEVWGLEYKLMEEEPRRLLEKIMCLKSGQLYDLPASW